LDSYWPSRRIARSLITSAEIPSVENCKRASYPLPVIISVKFALP
jgi:hypothetical protein